MFKVIPDVAVIKHGNEIRHAHAAIERLHAHGQLVAEIAHGRQAHAGHAQVLAESCGGFHVVFVERDDAVDLLRAREVRHSPHNVGERNFGGEIERVVEAFARPVGIAQLLRRKQEHAAALALALAHELLSFFVGGDAEKG